MYKLIMTMGFVALLGVFTSQARAQDDEGPAKRIQCEFIRYPRHQSQKLTFDAKFDPAWSGASITIYPYVIKIRSLLKYGNYDSEPNLVMKVSRGGRAVFESIMVASRDEYGAFTIGDATRGTYIWGRCDVIDRESSD